jgi:DNA-binding CsgD family transcriptional regulator
MSYKRWTAEDDAVLREMLPAGSSYREVGNKIGRTISSVAGRAWKLGIRQPEDMRYPRPKQKRAPLQARLTPEQTIWVIERHNEGWTASQLGEHLGLSTEAMKGRLKRLRAEARKSGGDLAIKTTRQDEVAQLLSEGWSFKDIAEELFITENAVEQAFKKICRNLGDQAR